MTPGTAMPTSWFWFSTCCLCQTVAYVLLLWWLDLTKPCHHPPRAKKTRGRIPTPLQREVTCDCGKEPRQEQHHLRKDSHGTLRSIFPEQMVVSIKNQPLLEFSFISITASLTDSCSFQHPHQCLQTSLSRQQNIQIQRFFFFCEMLLDLDVPPVNSTQ